MHANDQLVEVLDRYLHANSQHREWTTTAAPLPRCVEIRSATWEPWLRDGGRPGRRAFCGPLPTHISQLACDLLASLPLMPGAPPGRDRYVDRQCLERLSITARSSPQPETLVPLWVATMLWGSGTSNGRGPWRTAQGLSSETLTDVLAVTADAIFGEDLSGAYRRFRLRGTGAAFFTKWFWAVSLADSDPQRRPLILDQRVASALRRLTVSCAGLRGGAEGYVDYVDLLHRCADLLRHTYPHIDAERIEWLLFDRDNHPHTVEPCVNGWPA